MNLSETGAIPFPSYPFSQELGWSSTRQNSFEQCLRQYWYNYYNRWDKDVPRDDILELKNLSTIPMLIGEVAHSVLAKIAHRILKCRNPIDRQRLDELACHDLSQAIANSTFQEVYFGQQEAVEPKRLWPRLQLLLDHYLGSERHQWLLNEWDPSVGYMVDPEGYGEARLGGMKIYAKPDLLVRDGKEVLIIDWKTGQRQADSHRRQLAVYAAWARDALEQPANRIQVIDAYLQPIYEEVSEVFSEDELDAVVLDVSQQRSEMYELCEDVVENIPKPKSFFPMTERHGLCKTCSYRELCKRG